MSADIDMNRLSKKMNMGIATDRLNQIISHLENDLQTNVGGSLDERLSHIEKIVSGGMDHDKTLTRRLQAIWSMIYGPKAFPALSKLKKETCDMTRSIEASKLGIFYDQRCRAVTLKMAYDTVEDITDGNAYDEEYIESLASFSLKAESVSEMQAWVESINSAVKHNVNTSAAASVSGAMKEGILMRQTSQRNFLKRTMAHLRWKSRWFALDATHQRGLCVLSYFASNKKRDLRDKLVIVGAEMDASQTFFRVYEKENTCSYKQQLRTQPRTQYLRYFGHHKHGAKWDYRTNVLTLPKGSHYLQLGALPVLTLGDHGAGKEVREIEWRKEDGIDALPNLIVTSVPEKHSVELANLSSIIAGRELVQMRRPWERDWLDVVDKPSQKVVLLLDKWKSQPRQLKLCPPRQTYRVMIPCLRSGIHMRVPNLKMKLMANKMKEQATFAVLTAVPNGPLLRGDVVIRIDRLEPNYEGFGNMHTGTHPYEMSPVIECQAEFEISREIECAAAIYKAQEIYDLPPVTLPKINPLRVDLYIPLDSVNKVYAREEIEDFPSQLNSEDLVESKSQQLRSSFIASKTETFEPEPGQMWVCGVCAKKNTSHALKCIVCGRPPCRVVKPHQTAEIPSTLIQENKWACGVCGKRNGLDDPICTVCGRLPQEASESKAESPRNLDKAKVIAFCPSSENLKKISSQTDSVQKQTSIQRFELKLKKFRNSSAKMAKAIAMKSARERANKKALKEAQEREAEERRQRERDRKQAEIEKAQMRKLQAKQLALEELANAKKKCAEAEKLAAEAEAQRDGLEWKEKQESMMIQPDVITLMRKLREKSIFKGRYDMEKLFACKSGLVDQRQLTLVVRKCKITNKELSDKRINDIHKLMVVEEGDISAPIRAIAKWCSEAYEHGMNLVTNTKKAKAAFSKQTRERRLQTAKEAKEAVLQVAVARAQLKMAHERVDALKDRSQSGTSDSCDDEDGDAEDVVVKLPAIPYPFDEPTKQKSGGADSESNDGSAPANNSVDTANSSASVKKHQRISSDVPTMESLITAAIDESPRGLTAPQWGTPSKTELSLAKKKSAESPDYGEFGNGEEEDDTTPEKDALDLVENSPLENTSPQNFPDKDEASTQDSPDAGEVFEHDDNTSPTHADETEINRPPKVLPRTVSGFNSYPARVDTPDTAQPEYPQTSNASTKSTQDDSLGEASKDTSPAKSSAEQSPLNFDEEHQKRKQQMQQIEDMRKKINENTQTKKSPPKLGRKKTNVRRGFRFKVQMSDFSALLNDGAGTANWCSAPPPSKAMLQKKQVVSVRLKSKLLRRWDFIKGADQQISSSSLLSDETMCMFAEIAKPRLTVHIQKYAENSPFWNARDAIKACQSSAILFVREGPAPDNGAQFRMVKFWIALSRAGRDELINSLTVVYDQVKTRARTPDY